MRTLGIMNKRRFIAWLKTKPADEQFSYIDICNCCFAQYLRHCGVTHINVADRYALFDQNKKEQKVDFTDELHTALIDHPRTFGGVLERMKSVKKMEQKQ